MEVGRDDDRQVACGAGRDEGSERVGLDEVAPFPFGVDRRVVGTDQHACRLTVGWLGLIGSGGVIDDWFAVGVDVERFVTVGDDEAWGAVVVVEIFAADRDPVQDRHRVVEIADEAIGHGCQPVDGDSSAATRITR